MTEENHNIEPLAPLAYGKFLARCVHDAFGAIPGELYAKLPSLDDLRREGVEGFMTGPVAIFNGQRLEARTFNIGKNISVGDVDYSQIAYILAIIPFLITTRETRDSKTVEVEWKIRCVMKEDIND